MYVEYLGSEFPAKSNNEIVSMMESFNFVPFESTQDFRRELAHRIKTVYNTKINIETNDIFIRDLVKTGIVKLHTMQ